jgi:hypothetical protein
VSKKPREWWRDIPRRDWPTLDGLLGSLLRRDDDGEEQSDMPQRKRAGATEAISNDAFPIPGGRLEGSQGPALRK